MKSALDTLGSVLGFTRIVFLLHLLSVTVALAPRIPRILLQMRRLEMQGFEIRGKIGSLK